MRRGPTGILCGKGSGTNTRPLTPLAFFLPLPFRERAGVRGSGPGWSHAVIPDIINRESNAGVRGAGGTRRRLNLLRRLHHGIEGKRPWIPAENLRE